MSDIFFSNLGGFRILIKTSNRFNSHFTSELMIKFYPDNSVTPTFQSTNARCVLFGIGNGTSTNTNGFLVLLERYNSNTYFTVIYNNGSGWDYLPSINTGSIQGIPASSDNYYHVVFNYTKVDNSQFTYEFNVIQGPTTNPTPITKSATVNATVNSNPQCAFGSSNEDLGTSNRISNIDLTIGADTILGYVSTNIAMNYMRIWDGVITNNSTAYDVVDLFNINILNQPVPVSIGDPYPKDFDTGSYTQELTFQLDAKSSATLGDLYNTAQKTVSEPDGILVTLTNSPTGYSPLSDFGVNNTEGVISLESGSDIGGDPHIHPFIGESYFIYEEGTFLYFDYTDETNNNNFFKVYGTVKKLGKRDDAYFNDTITIHERKNDIEYKSTFDFNTFTIDNKQNNMIFTHSNNIKENNITIPTKGARSRKNLHIFALNQNIKLSFNDYKRNLYLRLNNDLIHKCSGAFISKEKLKKL